MTYSEIGGIPWQKGSHFGYLFPNPPGDHLVSYYPTRLSVWWKTDTAAGRTSGVVGNGGEGLCKWWNADGKNDGSQVFYSMAVLMACYRNLCGYGRATN